MQRLNSYVLVIVGLVLATVAVAAVVGSDAWLGKELAKVTGAPENVVDGVVPVFAVTGAAPLEFRREPKEDAPVLGLFPPSRAVWVMRPEGEFLLVQFKGVAAWVKQRDIGPFFTVNDPPQVGGAAMVSGT